MPANTNIIKSSFNSWRLGKIFKNHAAIILIAISMGAVGATTFFIGNAFSPVGDCYTQAGCTDSAKSAKEFTASVGINTHLGYSNTVYWQNWPMIKSRLLELGVSNIRDGSFAVAYPEVIAPTIAARYNELNSAGIKGSLLVGAEQAHNGVSLDQRLNWIKANVADFTTSIEGSNESPDDATAIRNLQCDIYSRVKNDPVLSSKPVIGPSPGPPFSGSEWHNRVGDLSTCVDKGNMHPYPGADPPHRHQSRDLSTGAVPWAQITSGAKPLWVTETGYWNHTNDANDVSEEASGTYIPRAFMENFRRGFERTQAYELIDLNTGTGQVIDNYGLLHNDGTPKPAFTAVKNMMAILKDSAAAPPSTLDFGIVCHTNCKGGDPNAYPTQDGPIRHVLIKHSSGAFYLAVWSESKVWDAGSKTDTPKPAQGFNLYLKNAPAKVEIFDPAIGASPISTDSSGSLIINTIAPDKLRLIKITPGNSPPPPTTGMNFEAESMSVTPMFESIPNPSQTQTDSMASASQRLAMLSYGTATKTINTTKSARNIVVRSFSEQCKEASGITAPKMTLKLDNVIVGSRPITTSTWSDYSFSLPVPAGLHTISIIYDNDYEDVLCNRNLYLDKITFKGNK